MDFLGYSGAALEAALRHAVPVGQRQVHQQHPYLHPHGRGRLAMCVEVSRKGRPGKQLLKQSQLSSCGQDKPSGISSPSEE